MSRGGEAGALRRCDTALFPVGRLELTSRARVALAVDEWLGAVARHAAGVFGDIDAQTELQNERAITAGCGAIRSVFVTGWGARFAVTTATDRSVTRIELECEVDVEGGAP